VRIIDITIIIPCYNEGPTFEESVDKIVRELKNLKENWEIIFVEDKSQDETKKSIERLVRLIKNSKTIYHKKNQGRGKSVADGIRKSMGEICGYLDVDLEVGAKYIPLFVKEIEEGKDMVVGKRFYEGEANSFFRYILSKAYAQIVKILLKIPIDDTEAGYKFFRRKKILPVLSITFDKHWFWDTEICARAFWSGLSISQIPVLFVRRADKKSTVKIIPDTLYYIVKILNLSFKKKYK